ncbi:MAG TPA: chromosome segregation SMC family protein [Candidatus Nitrosocosmicus sp.]
MVYIKKLEIFGFKSFGSRNITLNFQRGLIAVTGPNGSGKSNILDAILFALGENSPKALRVDRFQSLFHDNTIPNTNSNKIVRVSLTFDNIDRGIPVDKDNVTISREMSGANSGESQYQMNGKKVSRNNIMELLEIVVASPNKLNIVQQGMITRISELNSEERRKIIEDIIGLSYFDEKKNQALKQLEESDRRLEIALSKMNDVKNRIDDLELERNDQHRFFHLELQIKRLKAIRISGKFQKTIEDIENFNKKNNTLEDDIKTISDRINNLNQQMENLNKEKEQFLNISNESNKEKKELETKLSSVVYKYERNNVLVKELQYYINQTYQKEKNNLIEQQQNHRKLNEIDDQLNSIKIKIEIEEKEIKEIDSHLKEINQEIEKINDFVLDAIEKKNYLETRLKKLEKVKSDIIINIVRNEEKIKNLSDKIIRNDQLIIGLFTENKEYDKRISIYNTDIKNANIKITNLHNSINNSDINITKMAKELEISEKTIYNVDKAILKYDEKMNLAKNILAEDYAIASLLKDFKNLDIVGYVFDLLKWNAKYQKAIIASGNEWMKSIVVKDVKSMVTLAEYSKNNGIPFLKIIPIELLDGEKIRKIPDDPSILGVLSDFIYCNIKNLPEFLFGNTILTKNPLTAYILSKHGHKAVSVTGEIFFPHLSVMQFDYGSKISDLTKDILLSDSVESLKNNIEKLKTLTKLRRSELNTIMEEKIINKNLLNSQNMFISESNNKTSELQNRLNKNQHEFNKIIVDNLKFSSELDNITKIYNKYKSRLVTTEKTIYNKKIEIEKIEKENEIEKLNNLNFTKKNYNSNFEIKNNKLRQLILNQSLLRNNFENTNLQYQKIIAENEIIGSEKKTKETDLQNSKIELGEVEVELKKLREKENEIIQSASFTYERLQEYERVYKTLTENERKAIKELNTLEKEIAINNKDIIDAESQKNNHSNDLHELGYREPLESYDIEDILQDLKNEYNDIRERVNHRADETYLELIDGYRGMSDKKNQLEEERNSIVRFIEETGKQKENVFNNAFRKVDEDIRKTFSEITGGNAWLDLEDPENIFSGGILLMVQFPGKPGRESTGLSGGEKTMAAIVFLLALQSLKPSPFYLMDEVDAHLDAQNTERLSKILMLRSGNNQIIMVTLKDSTVAKSDLIFGVYPKNGISQVVKYNHPSKVKIIE